METLKFLPPDTRVELTNTENLEKLISNNPSKIRDILNAENQKLKRYGTGKTRLSLEQLYLLSKGLRFEWKNNISSFGLEASKHRIKLPENTEISKELAWLLGFHLTENSETPQSFGICNTEPTLIKRSRDVLSELKIPKEMMKIEVRFTEHRQKEIILKQADKYMKGSEIRFRKLSKKSLTKKPLYTLRVNSRLIKEYLKNLETHFLSNYKNYRIEMLGAFLQGIYDADGWFNRAKKIIVLSQIDKNLINTVFEFLKRLDIKARKEFWNVVK